MPAAKDYSHSIVSPQRTLDRRNEELISNGIRRADKIVEASPGSKGWIDHVCAPFLGCNLRPRNPRVHPKVVRPLRVIWHDWKSTTHQACVELGILLSDDIEVRVARAANQALRYQKDKDLVGAVPLKKSPYFILLRGVGTDERDSIRVRVGGDEPQISADGDGPRWRELPQTIRNNAFMQDDLRPESGQPGGNPRVHRRARIMQMQRAHDEQVLVSCSAHYDVWRRRQSAAFWKLQIASRFARNCPHSEGGQQCRQEQNPQVGN